MYSQIGSSRTIVAQLKTNHKIECTTIRSRRHKDRNDIITVLNWMELNFYQQKKFKFNFDKDNMELYFFKKG